jgi:hypothetical protein
MNEQEQVTDLYYEFRQNELVIYMLTGNQLIQRTAELL